VGGNISRFSPVKVDTQMSSDGTKPVQNVTLYGDTSQNGGSFIASTTTQGLYEAVINLEAISSRLEIGKVTAAASSTNISRVKSFTLGGIYINNTYTEMAVDYSSPAGLIPTTLSPDRYTGSSYAGLNAASLLDEAASFVKATDNITYSPNGGEVWGYNVLAPQQSVSDAPHIIVKLSDVVVINADGSEDTASYSGERWLTIRNLYGPGGAKITKLDNGYVYRIKELVFNESNLTDIPEKGTIDVKVTVTPIAWVSVDVTYDFN
jgi:hypothetical protein